MSMGLHRHHAAAEVGVPVHPVVDEEDLTSSFDPSVHNPSDWELPPSTQEHAIHEVTLDDHSHHSPRHSDEAHSHHDFVHKRRRLYIGVGVVLLVAVVGGVVGAVMAMGGGGGGGGSSSGVEEGGEDEDNIFSARKVVFKVALQGGDELDDPNAYQSCALGRTLAQEDIETSAMTEAKIIQYYALYSIYCATNGVSNKFTDNALGVGNPVPGWVKNDNWDRANIDPCDGWYGITCDNQGRVTEVKLFSNNLTGRWPAEVTLLASSGPRSTGAGRLNRIDIYDNMIHSEDPFWISELGDELKYLFFGSTNFEYEMEDYVLPSSIVEFDNSYTLQFGALRPEFFAQATKVQWLKMDGNFYNSSIPSIVGTLPSLTNLYLEDSIITGDLSYMRGMPKLYEHWVDGNPDLKGPIYPYIGDISTLAFFSATKCGLTGSLPPELSNIGAPLQKLWLYGNQLTGAVPTEYGRFSRLAVLQVEGNLMTGTMPQEVCNNRDTNPLGGLLETLGADCARVACDCCSCCDRDSCPNV